MNFDLVIKNYRCFPIENPVRIQFQNGFTAFLGANNSGKSTVLKFLFEMRDLFAKMSNAGNLTQFVQGNAFSFSQSPTVADREALFCNTNDGNLEIEIRLRQIDESSGSKSSPHVEVARITMERPHANCRLELFGPNGEIPPKSPTISSGENHWVKHDGNEFSLNELFQACNILSRALYVGPFRNAINIGGGGSYYDILVGKALVTQWANFKTGAARRQNEKIRDLTEVIRQIFKFDDLEINASSDGETLQLFINGKTYILPEMGSGIAHFILVLANIAFKNPSYILIDEPELNLHPSLQIDFLTTIASYSENGVLFATQNIGLARAVADQIYSVRRTAARMSEVREFEATPNLSMFLGELSYSSYRDLGFDKILLVEGPTDVKVFQQFLRSYRLDHQIVLIPLGGTSGINSVSEDQLQEIMRISSNVFALIDSERASAESELKKPRADFADNCEKAGIDCHVLERRATENYFTESAVKQVMGEKYQSLEPFQLLSDLEFGWRKRENWRIARKMTKNDLEGTDLGEFLSSL